MSIAHEAYFFDPKAFARTIGALFSQYRHDDDSYRRLRDQALQLFDASATVRALADWYGGWDRASIVADFPERAPDSIDDIAFWITILLYANLTVPSWPTALRIVQYRLLEERLHALGWTDEQIRLLIRGREIKSLVPAYLADGSLATEMEARDILRRVAPYSTCGHAGWLAYADVVVLRKRVLESRRQASGQGDMSGADACEQADTMLQAAEDIGSGLCLILSG